MPHLKTHPLPSDEASHKHRLSFWISIACLLFMAFILNGCSTSSTSTTPVAIPKSELTLEGKLDGKFFHGLAIGADAPSHVIELDSVTTVNMFTAQTCHRSNSFPDTIQNSLIAQWLAINKQFLWTYSEAPGIEDTGDCILRLCSYSNKIGTSPVQCAAVAFNSKNYQLPFQNVCNGAQGTAQGTALCHTMSGLTERVHFASPVVTAPAPVDASGNQVPISGQCQGKWLDATQTTWEYLMPSSECVIVFLEQAKPHMRAILTAIPYDIPQYIGGSK